MKRFLVVAITSLVLTACSSSEQTQTATACPVADVADATAITPERAELLVGFAENDAEKLGDLILSEGTKMGMIITATPSFRGRRIEAGLLSAGQDFSNETNPFSVGLGRFVDLEKDNFIGKKALINADKECRSWGIRVVDGIAKKGRSIKINGQSIGKVTSSTWSPYQVCGVGIALLDKSDVGPGTVVNVECVDEKIHKAELCKLPMYDPKGEIVRGINKNIPTKPEPRVFNASIK